MKQLITPFLLVGLLAAALAGCNSGQVVTVGLKVELIGIQRTGDGTVQVTWRVNNPNVVSYLLSETRHRIFLNGALVGSVVDTEPTAFPAQSHVDKTAKLTLAGAAAERGLSEAAAAGSAGYRVETQIIVQLYGDAYEKGNLSQSGTVPVTNK